jgi:hypothetical protein
MMNNGNTAHTVSLQDTRLTLLEHHPLVPIMVITTRISNLDVLLMSESTTPQRYMKRMWRSIKHSLQTVQENQAQQNQWWED